MSKLYLGVSYREIDKELGITKEQGCKCLIDKIDKLTSELNNACIGHISLDIIINLLKNIDEIFSVYGGSYYFLLEDEEFIQTINKNNMKRESGNIYKAWTCLLNDLIEDIDELYRYSETDDSLNVIFLKNLLYFLNSLCIEVEISKLDTLTISY